MGHVQTLLMTPYDEDIDKLVKPKHEKVSSCPESKCADCHLNKTGRSSTPTMTVVSYRDRDLNDDMPNQSGVVHLNQYMPGLPGLLPHTSGKEKHKALFTRGTIFVDGKTGFIHHHHQMSLLVGETLKGKNAFEKGAARFNIKIGNFKVGNIPFSGIDLKNETSNKGQEITSSGAGAHHPNGVTETAIKTITYWYTYITSS
jgi:hypothetical protein